MRLQLIHFHAVFKMRSTFQELTSIVSSRRRRWSERNFSENRNIQGNQSKDMLSKIQALRRNIFLSYLWPRSWYLLILEPSEILLTQWETILVWHAVAQLFKRTFEYIRGIITISNCETDQSSWKRLPLRQFKQVPHVLFVLFNICAEINYMILRIWIGRDALRQMTVCVNHTRIN